MKQFFRRYGRWLLLAIGVGLAALGAWFWWKAEQIRSAEALSEQFTAALEKAESGSTTEALASFEEISKSNNPSYRSLAAFSQAGIAVNGGDTQKAAALFKSVMDDPKAAQPLKDSATMKYLRVEFDKLPPAEIVKLLDPYLTGDSPWFPVAGELAALAHVKAGAPDKAGPLFYRIAADDRTPQSLRARAEQMASALGQDVTKIADEREAKQKAEADAAKAQAPAAADATVEAKSE